MSAVARRAPEPPLALWLATSLLVHIGIALLLVLGRGAWREHVGDRGTAGAGGPADAVEVTLLVDEPARAPRTEEPAAIRDVVPDEPTPSEPAPTRTAQRPSDRLLDPTAVVPPGVEEAASPTAEAGGESGASSSPGTSSEASAATEDGSGEGQASAAALILGSAGRLSGESVRASALLGENLACDDPIEGTWVAYRYSPEFRDWARFTLRIQREGTSLEGTIIARMWRGLPSERRPPPCSAEGWDYTVTMRATGNLLGDRVAFGASTHEVTRVDCASSFFSYNPDHFSGSVDPLADRMHTVNNDGGRDVNAPYEFHRTSCR